MNDIDDRLRGLAADSPPAGAPPPLDHLLARIRRRRLRAAGAMGAAAAVLALSFAALSGGEDPSRIRAAEQTSDTTDTTAADTTASETTTTQAPAAPPTTAPTTAPAPAAVTPTTSCRNSHEPSCGRFRWSPAPDKDQPLTLRTTITPAAPKVGETVTFRLEIDDPDAALDQSMVAIFFGEGETINRRSDLGEGCPSYRTRYGPWSPPAKVRGHLDVTYTVVYTEPGAKNWGYTVYSARCDQWGPGVPRGEMAPNQTYNPYASYGSDIGTLSVAEADSGGGDGGGETGGS